MKAVLTLALASAAGLLLAANSGELIYSEAHGISVLPCLSNSDTIVGVPFRPNGSSAGALSQAPSPNGDDTHNLAQTGISGLSGGEFAGTHYLKFTSGALEGRFFAVMANTADLVTVVNNDDPGENLGSAAIGDSFQIARFWTLDSLFPPGQATTAWTETPAASGNWQPNGHAIVASTGSSAFGRRTEILLPDSEGTGINLAPNRILYVDSYTGSWVSASGSPNAGGTILWPDEYMVIRHRPLVTHPTKFKASGEVELGSFSIPLFTITTGSQDNFIALPRPVALRLDQLGLAGTDAFVSSIGASVFGRRDQILVFDNDAPLRNKSASEIYYHNGTNWVRASDQSNADDAMLPAGDGFVIRKYKTSEAETHFWANPAPY